MLTKPREISKTPGTALHSRKRRRISPLMLIGFSVPALLILIAGGIFIIPRITGSHAATANPNCSLLVPNQPLTAAGLAKPYQLFATDARQGPCNENNTAQSAFVQAAILNPVTGKISVYNPLVIDQGTKPA